MEKKMRNWTSFILAIVASVVMVLITLFSMDYLVTIVNEGGANQQQLEQIIALFKIVYLVIVIIFAIINALFILRTKRNVSGAYKRQTKKGFILRFAARFILFFFI